MGSREQWGHAGAGTHIHREGWGENPTLQVIGIRCSLTRCIQREAGSIYLSELYLCAGGVGSGGAGLGEPNEPG